MGGKIATQQISTAPEGKEVQVLSSDQDFQGKTWNIVIQCEQEMLKKSGPLGQFFFLFRINALIFILWNSWFILHQGDQEGSRSAQKKVTTQIKKVKQHHSNILLNGFL